MGLSPFNRSAGVSAAATPTSYTNPNPNPWRFKVHDVYQTTGVTLADVTYYDCPTHGGRKWLILSGHCSDYVRAADHLDPHLLEKSRVIARLQPDDRGRELILRITGAACPFVKKPSP